MLAIRMQRTGRKGHAQFRIIVQDSRRTPTSGNYVALLGSYNPHTKELAIDKEKATKFVQNGAQPSERVAVLLKNEGVELPGWVNLPNEKQRTTRNPEKLRKNQPAEPATEDAPEAVSDNTETEVAQEEVSEASAEEVVENVPEAEEAPSEAPVEEDESKEPEA